MSLPDQTAQTLSPASPLPTVGSGSLYINWLEQGAWALSGSGIGNPATNPLLNPIGVTGNAVNQKLAQVGATWRANAVNGILQSIFPQTAPGPGIFWGIIAIGLILIGVWSLIKPEVVI